MKAGIQLENSEFAPCTISWDPGQGAFRRNTKDEVYLCCNEGCDKYRQECRKFCENQRPDSGVGARDCLFSCNVMGNVCEKICESARFDWGRRSFDKCLGEAGCFKGGVRGEILDEQCMVDQKDHLLDCCLRNCEPAPNINCPQHCGLSYDINLERSIQPELPKASPDIVASQSAGRPVNDRLGLYLAIAAFFLLIFFFVLFKLKWSSMKN